MLFRSVKTEKIPCHDQQQSFTVDLPPMSAVILRCVRKNPARKPKPEKAAPKKDAEKKPVKAEKKPAEAKKAAKGETGSAADKPKRARARKTDK